MDFIRTYLCCCLGSAHDHDPERRPLLPDYEIPNEQSQFIQGEEEGGG